MRIVEGFEEALEKSAREERNEKAVKAEAVDQASRDAQGRIVDDGPGMRGLLERLGKAGTLKTAAHESGMTQREVAATFGVSQPTVSRAMATKANVATTSVDAAVKSADLDTVEGLVRLAQGLAVIATDSNRSNAERVEANLQVQEIEKALRAFKTKRVDNVVLPLVPRGRGTAATKAGQPLTHVEETRDFYGRRKRQSPAVRAEHKSMGYLDD